jgi:hypothetical protein
MVEFVEFKKVHRLFRDIIITEKIDGTNSAVVIEVTDPARCDGHCGTVGCITIRDVHYAVSAQSRKRLLTKASDNFGFANWVAANGGNLVRDLDVGVHFGEWWGLGIQRGYDQEHRYFSLFNTTRWADTLFLTPNLRVTPVLYQGPFLEEAVRTEVEFLRKNGSVAAPDYMNPEGVITFHKPSNVMFKTTLENDDASKYEMGG